MCVHNSEESKTILFKSQPIPKDVFSPYLHNAQADILQYQPADGSLAKRVPTGSSPTLTQHDKQNWANLINWH